MLPGGEQCAGACVVLLLVLALVLVGRLVLVRDGQVQLRNDELRQGGQTNTTHVKIRHVDVT